MSNRKKIDDAKIKEFVENGYSDVEIAIELEISPVTVGQHRRKMNLPPNKKPQYLRDLNIDINDFKKQCEILRTDSAVSRYYKIGVHQVKNLRKKYNIKIDNYGANPIIEATHKQKEFIFGSLLGDGYCKLCGDDRDAAFSFNHSIKQKDYVDYKMGYLSNFPNNTYEFKRKAHKVTGEEYNTYTGSFKTNKIFTEFHKMFYDENNIKHIPVDYLEEYYTPLAMAIHYMDDGNCNTINRKSSNVSISTCGFEKDELLTFSIFLKNKYNLNNSITDANRIYIKVDSIYKFAKLIEPYICESMKYKIEPILSLNWVKKGNSDQTDNPLPSHYLNDDGRSND